MKKNIHQIIILLLLITSCSYIKQNQNQIKLKENNLNQQISETNTGEFSPNNKKNVDSLDLPQENQQYRDDYYPEPTFTGDIPEKEKISLDTLNYIFGTKEGISSKDITNDEKIIMDGIGEFVNSLGIIRYSVLKVGYGYIEKEILIQGDRTDIIYSFFIKGNDLYGVRKIRTDFNPPKRADYSKIETEKKEDCYFSLNNCSDDVLFLYDFIKTIEK